MEIPKAYDPKLAEASHYSRWEAQGCFAPEINRDPQAPVYTIVIPPPNVTGNLHMGHALQHTIMDVLARYHRMRGHRTLWLPGMDHAGISTQIQVEKGLKKEGLSRHDLGREKFLERVWAWKEQYGGEILNQMRREGASVDWSRARFTMDEGLTRAVREFFVRLYEKKWIYRGEGLINWCPKDQTALSDLEVDKVEKKDGKLYYLQYPVRGSDRRVTVATTRPETMLGDTGVAVSPEDERYADLVGAMLLLPIVGREIPVVADGFVDPEFGTGAVKVTPAHDPNDYAMGRRHDLPQVKVIDQHARMTPEAGAEFAGLDRYEARELVVAKFEELGLLEKVVDYEFSISQCARCRTVIEPLLSVQWFLQQAALGQQPLELIRERHEPRFVPEAPYEKVYTNWLEGLHDWTLSRQLWWGHRIPAWYDEAGNVFVARSEEDARKAAGTDELTQDPDVLDTWFSSALWPISTLGWPDDTPDLKTFYPTSVLVTARDIIFLWVARMMMTGLEFAGEKAFKDVFITGTIFDKHGQRMSKSKGNGVDPLAVFDKYGVDATRIVLASIGTTDTRWNDSQVESYRNFANKIWNAARFCLLNSEGARVGKGFEGDSSTWALHDRWIVSRLQKTTRDVSKAIEAYDFHAAVQTLYHFFWDDFCDWYIELSKADVTADDPSPARDAARSRVLTVLEQALRLLHPFMPFITEELWLRLPGVGVEQLHPAYSHAEPTVMLAAYPQTREELFDDRAEVEVQTLIEIVSRIRNIRSELNVKPSEQIEVFIRDIEDRSQDPELIRQKIEHIYGSEAMALSELLSKVPNLITMDEAVRNVLNSSQPQIMRLVRANKIHFDPTSLPPRSSARTVIGGGYEIAVPLEGLIDFAQERERLRKEMEKLENEAAKLKAQLSNLNFVARAPAEKVEELRQRVADIAQRTTALTQTLEALA